MEQFLFLVKFVGELFRMPLTLKNNWLKRPFDDSPEMEEYKTYYFVCEGQNTEMWYMEELINCLSEKVRPNQVRLSLLEKTGKDATSSHPKKLLELSKEVVVEKYDNFDTDIDKMVLIFDLDVYRRKKDEFQELLENREDYHIFAYSNPTFELFLLLHKEDAYKQVIEPNSKEIFENKKIGNSKKYLEKLTSEVFGINPKTNKDIGKLAKDIDTAIKEEKNINENEKECLTKLTCNIGLVIENIINDKA